MPQMPSGSGAPARRHHADRGATAVEYALMATLIAVAVVGSVTALGLGVAGLLVVPAGF